MKNFTVASSFVFFIALFTYNSSFAITINGEDINTLIKPEESLVYSSPGYDNICLRIKDGNIEIVHYELTNTETIKTFFNELESHKEELSRYTSKDTVSFSSGANISFEGAYISGDNKVLFNAQAAIEIVDSILKSKRVCLISSILKVHGCFLDTDVLHLQSNSPESLFQVIRFTFNKSIPFPALIQGQIDFAKNTTDGDFLVVGVQKVEFQFAPQVFKNR